MKEELRIVLALADKRELEHFLTAIKYCRKNFDDDTTLNTMEKACNDILSGNDPWKARTPQTPAGIADRITYFTGVLGRLWKQTGDK